MEPFYLIPDFCFDILPFPSYRKTNLTLLLRRLYSAIIAQRSQPFNMRLPLIFSTVLFSIALTSPLHQISTRNSSSSECFRRNGRPCDKGSTLERTYCYFCLMRCAVGLGRTTGKICPVIPTKHNCKSGETVLSKTVKFSVATKSSSVSEVLMTLKLSYCRSSISDVKKSIRKLKKQVKNEIKSNASSLTKSKVQEIANKKAKAIGFSSVSFVEIKL